MKQKIKSPLLKRKPLRYDFAPISQSRTKRPNPEAVLKWLGRAVRFTYATTSLQERKLSKKYLHGEL